MNRCSQDIKIEEIDNRNKLLEYNMNKMRKQLNSFLSSVNSQQGYMYYIIIAII